MSTALEQPQLLMTDEVAELLRVSKRTVFRLVEAGRLTPMRLSEHGRLRFRRSDVEDLIAGRGEPVETGVDLVNGRRAPAAPRSQDAGAGAAADTREAPCR